jgi:predicted dinucleotide-binding enzyme
MHPHGESIPIARLEREPVCNSAKGDHMNITIIGTGNMARGIATLALAGGHTVTVLGREPGKADAFASELPGEVRTGTVGDPLDGDMIVPAVWYHVLGDVVARYADQLDGKVLVDISNPVDPETFQPLTVAAGSAAQELAQAVPGAKVVKAFNTTFAGTLAEGTVAGQPLDVLIASDDDEAKRAVRTLAEDGGLRVVDAGPLAIARQLEGVGYVHMAVQPSLDTGYASAIKILG